MMEPGSGLAPRLAAWKALCDWMDGKGWLHERLLLHGRALNERDRALAWEMGMGVCRRHLHLQETVRLYSTRGMPKKDVLMALELGIWQLQEESRIAAHAAVHESVRLLKKVFSEQVARFGNAVLRKVQANGLAPLPEDPVLALSIRYSVQPWLVRHWMQNAERSAVEFRLQQGRQLPEQWIRFNPRRISARELAERIGVQPRAQYRERWLDIGVRIGAVLRHEAFEEGLFTIQNPASELMIRLMDLRPGQKVWDACAAPGGKTALMLEWVPDLSVLATDVDQRRLSAMDDLRDRLKLENFRALACDAGNPPFKNVFDRVLVDAPCSNLGVMARRPEVPLRLTQDAFAALGKKQSTILAGAARCLRPGGILVYGTCSPEPEETVTVVRRFLEENPDFEMEDASDWVEKEWVSEGCVCIPVNEQGFDQFFAARLRRRS